MLFPLLLQPILFTLITATAPSGFMLQKVAKIENKPSDSPMGIRLYQSGKYLMVELVFPRFLHNDEDAKITFDVTAQANVNHSSIKISKRDTYLSAISFNRNDKDADEENDNHINEWKNLRIAARIGDHNTQVVVSRRLVTLYWDKSSRSFTRNGKAYYKF